MNARPNTTRERYRLAEGKRLIEVRVHSALQLFDARDPAPFRARDLDDDFTEYVMAAADEFSLSIPIKILIHVEEPSTKSIEADTVRESIRSFFDYQIDLRRLQLSKLFKTARFFFGIGLVCLLACLLLSRFVTQHLSNANLPPVLNEGLIIFGWVSMWRPFELVLFDWYPVYDRIRLYRKLRSSDIEVRFSN